VVRKYVLFTACFILALIPIFCQAGPLADKIFGYCGWQSLSGTVSIQYAFDAVTRTPQVGEFYITDEGYVGLRATDDSWHEIIDDGKISEKLLGAKEPKLGTSEDFGPLTGLSRIFNITNGSEEMFDLSGEKGQTITVTAQDMDLAPLVITANNNGGIVSVQVVGFEGVSMDNFNYYYDQSQNEKYLVGCRLSRTISIGGQNHQLSITTQFTNVVVNPDIQSGIWGEP